MNLPEELKFAPMTQPHQLMLRNIKTVAVSYLAENTVRFQVPDAGILVSGSAFIEFVVDPNFVGGSFPLSIGGQSAINRARLVTQSGRVICDSREWNTKQVFEKTFRTAEYNRFVAPYEDGSFMTFCYNDTGSVDTSGNSIQNKLRVCGSPIRYEADGTTSPVNDSMTWSKPSVLTLHKGVVGTICQQWKVSLTELFPMLYKHMLPVQIMERIYIELVFEKDDSVGDVLVPVLDNGSEFDASGGVPDPRTWQKGTGISEQGLFLVTDHMIFDNPEVFARIEAQAQQKGGIAFPFEDYALQFVNITNADLTSVPSPSYENSRQLGCNNYKLCNIKVLEIPTDFTGVGIHSIFGKYFSNTPEKSTKKLNFAINDVNLYSRNDAQLAVSYDRTSYVYDHIKPAIPRPLFGCDIKPELEPLINSIFFSGCPSNTCLVNSMNVLGFYLKDGMGMPMKNGNGAIRVFAKYDTDIENGNLTSGNQAKYYIAYERSLAVSSNGTVMVNEYS